MKPISIPNLSTRPFNLKVERIMDAPPNVLFQAWTNQFDSWFAAPGSVIMQGKVNTPFFFETEFEDNRHPHYGRFLRLEQNSLVQITWVTGAGGTKGAETIVTIKLEPYLGGTKLCLTHSGFPDEESKNQHNQAWPIVPEQLDKRMLKQS